MLLGRDQRWEDLDGELRLAHDRRRVCLWDLESGRLLIDRRLETPLWPRHSGWPIRSPDGHALALMLADTRVAVFQLPGLRPGRDPIAALTDDDPGQALAAALALADARHLPRLRAALLPATPTGARRLPRAVQALRRIGDAAKPLLADLRRAYPDTLHFERDE